MSIRLVAVLGLALSACGLFPTPSPKPTTCQLSLTGQGTRLDQTPFTMSDECLGFGEVHARGFELRLPAGGPIAELTVSGRNLTDLDLNTVGDYHCDSFEYRLTVSGVPTDEGNPAYDQGGYNTLKQNTAVAGDCLYPACTISVTSPASSGRLALHFSGHLQRGKAGAVPPFYCDYMDLSFDLSATVTPPLSE